MPKATKHPGVTLLKPNAASRSGWKIRWVDPDSGKVRKQAIPASCDAVDRLAIAKGKSRELSDRHRALATGATRRSGMKVTDAITLYFKHREHALREATVRSYRTVTDHFAAWCDDNGVVTLDDLTVQTLSAYRVSREQVIKADGEPRSAHSSNREIRSLKVVVMYWARQGLLGSVNREGVGDALTARKTVKETPVFLRGVQIQALLKAAEAHDAATYTETRWEHSGRAEKGQTRRYGLIYPFVRTLLFTGMRFTECVELTWESVDLDHRQIRLSGNGTKTHAGRVIDLAVCPSLVSLLASLKPVGATGRVFGHLTSVTARKALERLRDNYGAPEGVTAQVLRRTTGTYLTCAPGIYGGASAYMSARRLGHSIEVAMKYYAGQITTIPRDAETLELAMGL